MTKVDRPDSGVRVVAIMAVRNERPYLVNCLNHLIAEGVDYFIIDNESDDGSAEILHDSQFASHLAGYRTHPYRGAFDLEGILAVIEAAIPEIDADWVLHQAPDEILHSYRAGERMIDAIGRIDAAGHDVIDFNEFVFLPIDHEYVVDHPGAQPLRWYYLHQPAPSRQMRLRRRALQLSWLDSGGHRLKGQPYKLAPETFALRHYLFRNQAHALTKFAERQYRQEEIDRVGTAIGSARRRSALLSRTGASLIISMIRRALI